MTISEMDWKILSNLIKYDCISSILKPPYFNFHMRLGCNLQFARTFNTLGFFPASHPAPAPTPTPKQSFLLTPRWALLCGWSLSTEGTENLWRLELKETKDVNTAMATPFAVRLTAPSASPRDGQRNRQLIRDPSGAVSPFYRNDEFTEQAADACLRSRGRFRGSWQKLCGMAVCRIREMMRPFEKRNSRVAQKWKVKEVNLWKLPRSCNQ